MGVIHLVGFGPGHAAHVTRRAREAIASSDVVVGYTTYIRLIADLLEGKEVVQTGMTEEIHRAAAAVDRAEAGSRVAVVSSGDAGIYGMAGLVFELLLARGWRSASQAEAAPAPAAVAPAAAAPARAVHLFRRPPNGELEVEVVPGVSALNAAAALAGAPLMNDFAAVSLSDHLTPWDVIARRLEAAAAGDFVIVLYNPASGRRTWQLAAACEILRRHRSADTPVAVVKSAFRERQRVEITDLARLPDLEIGMLTTIIIGNSATRTVGDLLVTPRGYDRKYSLLPATGDDALPATPASGSLPTDGARPAAPAGEGGR